MKVIKGENGGIVIDGEGATLLINKVFNNSFSSDTAVVQTVGFSTDEAGEIVVTGFHFKSNVDPLEEFNIPPERSEDDINLRIFCLEKALAYANPAASSENWRSYADKFYDWVVNN